MRSIAFLGVLATIVLITQPADADVLITKAEAAAPPPPPNIATSMRGVTRGPGIEQISPDPNQKIRSPLPLKIKFQIRNNVEIDPASIKLIYLRMEPIDLTERIKAHIKSDGITMELADVPPGLHMLRLELLDKQGRAASLIIKLNVAAD